MYTTLVCVLFVATPTLTLVCVLFVATPTSTISVYYFSICTLLKYVYCLWPLPFLVLVCTTLVCVLFVATPMSSISVYYFSMCTVCGHSYELGVHVYCLWPLLLMCLTIVLVCIVYYSYSYSYYFRVNCTSQLPICVSYNSVSVYSFYYYILKLYLPPPGGKESPWTTASHWRQKQKTIFFLASFIYSRTSCANRAQLATAWSTGDTCTVCGHPTMSNYFITMSNYFTML